MEQALKELRAREAELTKYPDYEKRRSLFLSWLGQADKCIRKGFLQDEYYHALFWEWIKKAEKLVNGEPLEACKGKIRIKGKKPMQKKQRLKWKAEHKTEIRAYRKQLAIKNEEKQHEQHK